MGQKAVGAISNTFGANAFLPQYYRHDGHTPGSSTFCGYVKVCLRHYDLLNYPTDLFNIHIFSTIMFLQLW